MDGSHRVSDFSIERILSPQLGHKPPPPPPPPPAPAPAPAQPQLMDFTPDGFLHKFTSGGFCLDPASLRPSVPVPVPVQGRLHVGGMCLDETFYTCGSNFTRSGIFPNSGVFLHLSSQEPTEPPQFSSYHHGYQHTHVTSQSRQKARMRTVFTDCQTKHLEALFEITDYPAVEERAEVARSTGLSEETVRVWFKNRRARRKRQRSGSKVKSP